MSITSVGVIGAGTMGHGIAQVFAVAGLQVRLQDVSEAALARGLQGMRDSLARLQCKEKLTAEQVEQALARVSTGTDLAEPAGCDLVVEAATERLDLKLEIFRELDRLSPPHTLLASNTSSIPLTRIAAATDRPQQVLGMHFSNPVPMMPLVEVIAALQTDEDAVARIEELARRIGKTPVRVNDSYGFVTNRLLMPMINEAVFCLHEGVASAEAIDQVMRLGMSHPMGPLALADLVGLDTCLSIMEVLYQGFDDPKYRPCPLLKQKVAAGHLGRKSGRGFYDYAKTEA